MNKSEDEKDDGYSYNQSGNFGLGDSKKNTFGEHARVSGVYNEIHNYSSNPTTNKDVEKSKFTEQVGKFTLNKPTDNELLVNFKLHFFAEQENIRSTNLLLKLTIVFATVDVEKGIPSKKDKNNKVNVRFGIKYGKLHLNFAEGLGSMPLEKREQFKNEKWWQAIPAGTEESPMWQFKPEEKKKILEGSCNEQTLGFAKLSNTACVLEGSFKVSIPESDITIISQEGLWDNIKTTPQERETIMRRFIKVFIKPELEKYLSKVKLEYDSAI